MNCCWFRLLHLLHIKERNFWLADACLTRLQSGGFYDGYNVCRCGWNRCRHFARRVVPDNLAGYIFGIDRGTPSFIDRANHKDAGPAHIIAGGYPFDSGNIYL